LKLLRLLLLLLLLQGFLGSDWQDPSEFKGCGKFVADSWRILCKGTRDVKGERLLHSSSSITFDAASRTAAIAVCVLQPHHHPAAASSITQVAVNCSKLCLLHLVYSACC
jgi:hypothetical protein